MQIYGSHKRLFPWRPILFMWALLFPFPCLAAETAARKSVYEIDFSTVKSVLPAGWEEIRFSKTATPTRYTLTPEGIEASTETGVSALARYEHMDACPGLHLGWEWKVLQGQPSSGVSGKSGDDYAARVGVTFVYDRAAGNWWDHLKWMVARKIYGERLPGAALEYLWTMRRDTGEVWDNPYTERAKMIKVSGAVPGAWEKFERNICADYEEIIGNTPPQISGIFMMTDADNTKEPVRVIYRNIRLWREEKETGK